jgi:hypothetical protein
MRRVQPSFWLVMALVSFIAGASRLWGLSSFQSDIPSPLTVAITTMLVTFLGWFVWGFFTYLIDTLLFGGDSNYSGTVNAFGRAYVCQTLVFFTFITPLGWLWGWIALYCTVTAWGIVGPRHLGMRTWQAIVAVTLGMLMWLACLLILSLTLSWDGLYIGVGAVQIKIATTVVPRARLALAPQKGVYDERQKTNCRSE